MCVYVSGNNFSTAPKRFPVRYGFLLAAALLIAAEMGIQTWASSAIPKANVSEVLHYAFPGSGDPGFEQLDLKNTGAPDALSYDRGGLGRFTRPEGLIMDVFHFEHDTGNTRYLDDIYGHQPERCMTNAGATFVKNNGIRPFECGGQTLHIRCLAFTEPPSGRSIFIYKLIWVPPGYDAEGESTWTVRKKIWIRRALTRLPWPPSRLILAGVRHAESEEAAWNFFKQRILEQVSLVDSNQ